MVPADNPVIVLWNDPVPVPAGNLELRVVGVLVVLQQTPLSVIVWLCPPAEVTFPPVKAEFWVTELDVVVVTVGTTATVVKITSFP